MESKFDQSFDVVIIGSGSAGFATAMGAVDEGLRPVIIESTDHWGGSSAMSGGGMWLPNNPLMQRDRVGDSREEALEYMRGCIGDAGPSTSDEHLEAFVDHVADFVETAEKFGMEFARATDYPDYYPELPGGKVGRSIEIKPFNSKKLGSWVDSLRMIMPIPMMTNDVWLIGRAWSTPRGFLRGAQFVGRTLGGLLTGKKNVGIGAGLMAAFGEAILVKNNVPLWLNSPLEELIFEDGKVVGVVANRGGKSIRIEAKRGVMLAGGGFDHRKEWRQEHHGIAGYPSGNPGNVGGPLEIAMKAGAATSLLDDAWWGASIQPIEGGDPSFIVGERSLPYSIIVDSEGKRFANEAESYVDLGHHMLEHDKDGDYWFILDSRHTRRYLRTFAIDPKANKAMAEQGILVKADSLPELATKLGLDLQTFRTTIERFNGFARSGRDQDFNRGDSAYDRYYGDPTVIPNSTLGPIEKGPFTAYKVVIGDLGTKGGVVTTPNGEAVDTNGNVIPGLYSAGNNSASVMGRTYPGPGSTIGPAVVFGLISARHMAKKE